MTFRWVLLLCLVLVLLPSGGCRRPQQPDQPQQPTKATEASASDHITSPAQTEKQRPQPEPPEKHSQPQRLNPAFPYPDGYKPEIRLNPPPVPPEIVGPSPPIKR